MRVGIGSYTYPYNVSSGRITCEDLLDLAIEIGAGVVQYCENLPLTSMDDQSLNRLIARAEAANVSLEVGTRGLDAANLAKHAELATRLGSGFFRLVIHEQQDNKDIQSVAYRLESAMEACSGVVVAIENHDRLPLADLIGIIHSLGTDRAGITLDTANSLGCLEGTNEVVSALAPYTKCLHVKDIVAVRLPTMLGFTVTGTVAGKGQIDIPGIIGRMPSSCDSAILEQWTRDRAGSAPPLADELESAREGFAYLKSVAAQLVWPCAI